MGLCCWLKLLDDAALYFGRPPFWLLVAGHSLTAVAAYRTYTRSWLVSWFVCFTAAFGGGTLTALLMQSPRDASIALFAKNDVALAFTATWWIYNYLPGGWGQRLGDAPAVRVASKVARSVLRANQIVQRVSAAAQLFPGVTAAPLVLGTLAGAGGKLFTDAYSHLTGATLPGPTELAAPGFALWSAALAAAAHYVLVHVLGVLSVQQGLGLAISVFVAHSLATDLTGQPCDYTAPFAALFYKLTLIPPPGTPAAATPAAKARRTPRTAAGGGQGAAAAALTSPEQTDGENDGEETAAPAKRRTARRRVVASRA